MRYKAALIVAACLVAAGCGSLRRPYCVGEGAEQIAVRWGTKDSSGVTVGGELDGWGRVYTLRADSAAGTEVKQPVGVLGDSLYCDLSASVKQTFLKVQTLYSPGASARFVEWSDPRSKTVLRAVWNPKFQTHGSAEFRALFGKLDSLQSLMIND